MIIGNPPYSVGQKSENDNAKNQKYPILDAKIAGTYVVSSSSSMNKALYDAYIKAFRWSTDRLDPKNGGIVCFVSNGAWLEGNTQDGFRKCLEKEFSSIYVFNLRGNQRTSGELSRREGGKIFGSGSRTPIAITLLVKNPEYKGKKAQIYYYDIGDYLSREEKLAIVKGFKSVRNPEMKWKIVKPNEYGDWLNQRSNSFGKFFPLSEKGKHGDVVFLDYSNGVVTNRDHWVYGFSKSKLEKQVRSLIGFFNDQVVSFSHALSKNSEAKVGDVLCTDSSKISWSRDLKRSLKRLHRLEYSDKSIVTGLYRPFSKQYLYFNRKLNECVYQIPRYVPDGDKYNRLIGVPGVGASKEFSTIMVEDVPNLHFLDTSVYFPLYCYDEAPRYGLFANKGEGGYIQRDGISDFILELASNVYGEEVNKEDIFYYVYGLLHSPNYRRAFAHDLKKMLPRIPLVDKPEDFWAFSRAGRELADLHINYEKESPYEDVIVSGVEIGVFRVEKMRFPKRGVKDTILYNSHISIENIPEKAYEYVVNGKSAIEWIMDRYKVTTHKASGIKNDPNDWAEEVGNPRYILDLLLSIINVSVKTVEIVENLPEVIFKQ